MHRAQILIEEWQYQTLRSEADRVGKSVSELIRDMLTDRFRRRRRKDGLDDLDGIVSEPKTTGKDHDLHLYGTRKPR